MSSFHFDLDEDTVLVHNADDEDHAWETVLQHEPDYAEADKKVYVANPDMGESQTLQYDHVFYAR